jgi:hypothetical protein
LIGDRQSDGEGAAGAGLALDPDAAAMELNQ